VKILLALILQANISFFAGYFLGKGSDKE